MKCQVCKTDKLSKEFPLENISESCEHPSSCCFRCMISHFQSQHLHCPYIGCKTKVPNAIEVANECKSALDQLYPPVGALDISHDVQMDMNQTDKTIIITTLAGDTKSLPYNTQMMITQLKQEIQKRMNVATDKQHLMYKDVVLEEYRNNAVMKLGDYGVPPFVTIHLMILLYAIPSNFNHVIFDLYWGYPAGGCDFLDASCLIFSGNSYVSIVDWSHTAYNSSAIWHSGDVMDHTREIGHHTIEVRLKNIPATVTHLYFTLSAWNSPTISRFPNPSLKFFEASNKQKDLCGTSFTHAKNSQAVIMCSVRRMSDGHWRIFQSGQLSAGNAMNYGPLIKTIQQPQTLIQ